MDTGEWRYGQDSDNRPWTEPAAAPDQSADLWTDDGAEAWSSTSSWRPRHQADPNGSSPISPTSVGSPPDDEGGYGSTAGGYGARAGAYPSGGYPIRGYSTGYTAPPRYGVISSTPPTSGASSYGSAAPYGAAAGPAYGSGSGGPAYGSGGPGYGSAPVSGSAAGSMPTSGPGTGAAMVRRPGLGPADTRSRPRTERRDEEAPGRLGRIPQYLKVLWFTAAWYGGSLVLYLLWLAIAGGDREAIAGREFVSGLPWMFAAVLISGALATALRRLTIGWGAIGVSFAATVIGAGLATIIHSFA